MSLKILFTLIALFFACAISQPTYPQFTSDLFIHKDPSMNPGSGITVNKLYYDFTNQKLRMDYPDLQDPKGGKKGLTEIYDFGRRQVSQLCKDCSVYKYFLTAPEYFKNANDRPAASKGTIKNDKGEDCAAFEKGNPVTVGDVKYIWVTKGGAPCRAERSDGTTLEFKNVQPGAPSATLFAIDKNAKCPEQPICGAPIDLVLVFDQSGSITRTEWAQLGAFGQFIVNSFEIGPTKTQIGLVYFSGVDYRPNDGEDPSSCCGLAAPVLPLSFDKPTIEKFITSHRQTGGHTCINCGVKAATKYEPNPNRPIQVPKIMLVLTDGFNNRMTNFFPIDIANAKREGWKIFAIGVRDVDVEELKFIASNPVDSHYYNITNFDGLKQIQQNVVNGLCSEFPALTPCGTLCKGKCGCGGQCLCPDTCNTGDKCQVGKCVINVAGSGCIYTPKLCDQKNIKTKCEENLCNPQTGLCETKKKVCAAPDPCFTQTCDDKLGCVYTDKCLALQKKPGTTTDDFTLCLKRKCDTSKVPTGECKTETLNCTAPANNKCLSAKCDEKLGCTTVPVNCDDGNRCTNNVCDPLKGCVSTPVVCPSPVDGCLVSRCDPKVGCVTTPKTCDDGNKCTKDSCVNGQCVNTPITCAPLGNDLCNELKCDANLGCIKVPRVTCDDGKACTTDRCVPETGKCEFTPLACPGGPSNNCFESKCDEASKKCVTRPKVICPNQDQNDKCITSICDPNTGACANQATTCTPPGKCATAKCDPKAGCVNTPITCDDGNVCTQDKCDPIQGCVSTPIPGCKNQTCVDCTTTDPCNPKVCEDGNCVTKPITCNPNNKCAKETPTVEGGKCVCKPTEVVACPPIKPDQCGENICDPATGTCSLKGGRVCNDNDPCTEDSCVLVNGQPSCIFTSIKCPGDSPCSRKKCVNNNGVAQCVDDKNNGIQCDGTSECVTGLCDPQTGKCSYTPKVCEPNATSCSRQVCNPETRKCEQTNGLTCVSNDPLGCGKDGKCALVGGKPTCQYDPVCPVAQSACKISKCTPGSPGTCQTVDVQCKDDDPCTINERCIVELDANQKPIGKCTFDPFNCTQSGKPCEISKCVNNNGKPQCKNEAVACPPPNKCQTGECVVVDGKGVCQFKEINCGQSDACQLHRCDPLTGCNVTLACNDGNNCTTATCKNGKCTFTEKVCNSSSICKKGVCDSNVGCIETPVDCTTFQNVTKNLDACHFPVCSPTEGCKLDVVPNTLDACGQCQSKKECKLKSSSSAAVAAGAIAGAVIGGAVVAGAAAVGIGALFAKKAADGFAKKDDDPLVGACVNPVFQEQGLSGDNPFNAEYNALPEN